MSKPIRLLHFADAHIDIANYGRHDPDSLLPVRVMDFLRALDQIIDAAVSEKVDLVIFAGDAYKDRNPQPTFQREWGQRMMRLSQAGIPTVLLVGNHDVAPAAGRAHTIQEFKTLAVPHIQVADRLQLLGPAELGLPIQIACVPWVSRSQLMTREEMAGKSAGDVLAALEDRVMDGIARLLDAAEPNLPLILTAHASVQGAKFGSERAVMLGHELVLTGSVVNDKRLDYVALGHIHKHQALNDGRHPPIVYPGSIERINFGEVNEEKGYVLAEVGKGHSEWQFVKLNTRHFIDLAVDTRDADSFMADIMAQLPPQERVTDAVCRLRLTYPADWETLLDEAALNTYFSPALSFQIQKHRLSGRRARLGDTAAVESLSPAELLDQYWQTIGLDDGEAAAMQTLAGNILRDLDEEPVNA